jgi:hypothetical protein
VNKVILHVETPKTAGERIANAHDPKQYLFEWTARRGLAKLLEKEFKARDEALLKSVNTYLKG